MCRHQQENTNGVIQEISPSHWVILQYGNKENGSVKSYRPVILDKLMPTKAKSFFFLLVSRRLHAFISFLEPWMSAIPGHTTWQHHVQSKITNSVPEGNSASRMNTWCLPPLQNSFAYNCFTDEMTWERVKRDFKIMTCLQNFWRIRPPTAIVEQQGKLWSHPSSAVPSPSPPLPPNPSLRQRLIFRLRQRSPKLIRRPPNQLRLLLTASGLN